jgi:hypothetical protein
VNATQSADKFHNMVGKRVKKPIRKFFKLSACFPRQHNRKWPSATSCLPPLHHFTASIASPKAPIPLPASLASSGPQSSVQYSSKVQDVEMMDVVLAQDQTVEMEGVVMTGVQTVDFHPNKAEDTEMPDADLNQDEYSETNDLDVDVDVQMTDANTTE